MCPIMLLCTIGCSSISPPRNETWSAQLIYFNHQKHSIDTTYSSVVMYEDSIVNFKTPTGRIWMAKEFLENSEINDTNPTSYDVTVSSGERFKIMPLDSGNIKSKATMDSIKDSYVTEDQD